VFIGVKIAFEYLNYSNGFAWIVNNVILTLIYFAVALVIIAVLLATIDSWGKRIARKTKSSIDDALMPLFRTSTRVVVLLIVAIMVLAFWGVDVAGLLAGVGIAGIAIGFAVKDSLGNIFGGISLILDKTFNVGDRIGLDDGTIGIVKHVSLRSTRIHTFDNEYVTIPNGELAVSKIKNYNQPDRMMRVVVPFGVEYGAKPEKVKELVLKEIKSMKGILKDPAPSVVFTEMADFALNMKARFYVEDLDDAYGKKEEATTLIYNLLNKKKIGIPFPTSTVYVHKGK
jgi:small-conductance mechanosensitive channel